MMLLVSPLLAIGYIVQGLAEESYQLNIGRFISGIAGGLACGPGAVIITLSESHLKHYVLLSICMHNFSPGFIGLNSCIFLLNTFLQAYVTEVSDSKWRTTFNSGLGIFCLFGTVSTYVLGAILHWRTIIYLSCIYPFGSFIIALMVPESPPWLITKGMQRK